jgi:transcriptional regulator with XRE-family HTH domain
VDTVKEIRRRKGWSQKDLAKESGVGQDTISGIESGRHEPRPSTLRKLADALDVEVADFFRKPALPLDEVPRGAGQPDLTEAWKKFYNDLLTVPAQPLIEQSDEEIALFREAAEKAARGEKPITAGFLEDEPPARARLAAEALRLIEEERRQEKTRR